MKRNVVMVLGSTPGEKSHPIEVYLEQEGADYHILNGLLGAFKNHVTQLEAGGTLSLIVSRAPVSEEPTGTSSGSFVINNPKGDRHVWDFTTINCDAEAR